MLAKLPLDVPIVYAGMSQLAEQVEFILTNAGKKVYVY